MIAGARPGSRAVTAEISDHPAIMAALRVEAASEVDFGSKADAAPAGTGKAETVFTGATDAVELTAGEGPMPEAKPVPQLASANFEGAASSAASPSIPAAANPPMIQVATLDGQRKPTYAGMWGRAGETFCRFKKKQETQSGWNLVANCSNGGERWVANVRLKIQGERLTWSSERGSQAYVRCEPGMTVAQAN